MNTEEPMITYADVELVVERDETLDAHRADEIANELSRLVDQSYAHTSEWLLEQIAALDGVTSARLIVAGQIVAERAAAGLAARGSGA